MANYFDQYDAPQQAPAPQPVAAGGNYFDRYDPASPPAVIQAAAQGAAPTPAPSGDTTPPADLNAPSPSDWAQAQAAQIPRQLGLAGRYIVEGAAGLPAAVANVPASIYDKGADLIQGQGNGFRFPDQNAVVADALTGLGLPQPENSNERIIGDASRAVAGVGTGVGAANAIGDAAGPMTQAITQAVAEAPKTQALSAASSGLASGGVREDGGSPWAQMFLGTLAGIGAGGATNVAGRGYSDLRNTIDQSTASMRDTGYTGIKGYLSGLKTGRDQMVGQMLDKGISGSRSDVINNLDNVQDYVPNSPVTTGEASGDAGLAGMQRGLRNASGNANPFGDIESQQNLARNQEFDRLAGSEADIEAAKQARNDQTGAQRSQVFENYNNDPRTAVGPDSRAFASDVRDNMKQFQGADWSNPDTVNQLGDTLSDYGYTLSGKPSASGKAGVITATKTDPVTGQDNSFSVRVGQNPLPSNVQSGAIDLVGKTDGHKVLADQIIKNEPTKDSVNPNYAIGIANRRLASPEGNLSDLQTTMETAKNRIQNAINIGNPEYAYALRKDLANDVATTLAQKNGGIDLTDPKKYQRYAAGQMTDILDSLDTQIDKAAPGYKDYMTKYKEMSQPINQMETMQDIRNRTQMNAAPDVQAGVSFLSQPKLTQILRDPDGSLAKTLTPDQMQGMKNIESDMTRSASLNARNVRPTGSDTAANLESGNMVGNFLKEHAASVLMPGLQGIGKMVQNIGTEKTQQLLVQAFRDPEVAKQLLTQLRPDLPKVPYSGATAQKLIASMIGTQQGVNN